MRRLIVGGLSFMLLLAATAPALKADAAAVNLTPANSTVMSQPASPISPWLLRVNQTRNSSPVTVAASPTISPPEVALNSTTLNSTSSYELTPFNLVSLANQGYFKSQGVPSYSGLLTAYASGRVNAASLIQSAVATHRLSPQILNDQKYLSAVNTQLYFLTSTR